MFHTHSSPQFNFNFKFHGGGVGGGGNTTTNCTPTMTSNPKCACKNFVLEFAKYGIAAVCDNMVQYAGLFKK